MKYLLYNGKTVTGEGVKEEAVAIDGGRIEKTVPASEITPGFLGSHGEYQAVDLGGKLVFAGGIDAHVHFREPGMTHKADISSESRAAVAGGVTSFIDMPNTVPATISAKALAGKLGMAAGRSYANYGFHLGATDENLPEIMEILRTGKDGISGKDFGGIKVFMGSSTGNMLVEDGAVLDSIFGIKEKEILVHCEDEKTIRANTAAAEKEYGNGIPFRMHSVIRSREACILSSARALELAGKHGTRLHLLHISTEEEIEMVRRARMSGCMVTAETSSNYLWFCDSGYGKLGSRMKCNPSVKTSGDRAALRKALKDGLIDTIGSDHAPHLPGEKERGYLTAPSGMPSVQQTLQVLLTVAAEDGIPLERIASVFSEKAAVLFGIRDRGFIRPGYAADLTIVDPDATVTIGREDILYKCGWSPYEGVSLRGKVTDVFVNGKHVVKDSAFSGEGPAGEKLIFEK